MKRFLISALLLVFCMSYASFAYNDVHESDWYYSYITDLSDRGIISGPGDGNFYPGRELTRAEFVKILAEASGDILSDGETGFLDVEAGKWYAPYVKWAADKGIVLGYNGMFDPLGKITRQDMAVILIRFADSVGLEFPRTEPAPSYTDAENIADYAAEAVYFLQKAGIMSGSGGAFYPLANATRAEAAKIVSAFLAI